MILVSACLAGYPCRYNGSAKADEWIIELVRSGQALPVCPESLAGFPVPRAPMELTGDGAQVLSSHAKALTRDGTDVSQALIRGAKETLRLCSIYHIQEAILKSNSPSCGYGQRYDGTFQGRLCPGHGVTSALLEQHGIKVQSHP